MNLLSVDTGIINQNKLKIFQKIAKQPTLPLDVSIISVYEKGKNERKNKQVAFKE
jgi:hypothetical protein